jgi:transketolase
MDVASLRGLQGTLRLKMLDLHKTANSGHIGCSMSCIDILIAALIYHKKEGDDFILSKGHAAVALYICLNYLGEISDSQLSTFYQNGTSLPAHPAPQSFKNIPFATGSLGHGLPVSCGIAKANKIKRLNGYAFVIMSDGETNEGTTWEAAHFAVAHKLDNLIVIIDRNRLQGFGSPENILGDTASPKHWQHFGFDIEEIDGHDIEVMDKVIEKMKGLNNGRPKLIIANTVKGKGISFMESQMEWHYLPMTDAQYKQATQEVRHKYLS